LIAGGLKSFRPFGWRVTTFACGIFARIGGIGVAAAVIAVWIHRVAGGSDDSYGYRWGGQEGVVRQMNVLRGVLVRNVRRMGAT
jgi:hypothetical protein